MADDDNTLDIVGERYAFWYYMIDVRFEMEVHRYSQIKVYFTENSYIDYEIWVYYTSGSPNPVLIDSLQGGDYTLNVDSSRYLDTIVFYTSIFFTTQPRINIDFVAAVPV